MAGSGIVIAKPNVDVAEQVKIAAQDEAQAKQRIVMKEQRGAQIGNVLNALMTTFALDEDNAICTSLTYAATLAQATGTTKEAVLKGFDTIWEAELANREKVKDEQKKMLAKVVKSVMDQKQPLPMPLVGQIQALGAMTDEIQAYIDAQPEENGATGKLQDVPDHAN